MNLRRTLLAAALAFGLPLTSAAQPPPTSSAAADADPMSDKALELFNEGKKLFREGKYGQAEAAFEAAWAIALKSKGIAANLGESEMRLGKYREAAEHLAISLRLAPPTDPQRTRTEANFATVKGKVGTLVVTTNPPGAEILVNGIRIGDAPLLDPVFVDPGKVKLRVRLEGYTSWEKELDVAAGQEVPLDVVLEKPAPPPSATPSATVTASPPGPRKEILIGGAAVAGVALITSIATGIAAGIASNDATRQRDELLAQPGACVAEPPAGACSALEAKRNEQSALSNAALLSFIGAGLVGGATIAYALIARPKASLPAVGVSPAVSTSGGGLIVVGRF